MLTFVFRVLILHRAFKKFRQCGIHVVPRLSIAGPNVHLLVEPARIIQARGSSPDDLGDRVGRYRNGRATVGAKAAMRLSAGTAGATAGKDCVYCSHMVI
jgi:hypothetical protein